MADALDSKSSAARHAGSSPAFGTSSPGSIFLIRSAARVFFADQQQPMPAGQRLCMAEAIAFFCSFLAFCLTIRQAFFILVSVGRMQEQPQAG